MLYCFKSSVTADLTLLQTAAEQLLKIIGKTPGPQGVITPEEAAAALQALDQAVVADGSSRRTASSEETHLPPHVLMELEVEPGITLAQRASPFAQMLREAAADGATVTWGV